MRRIFSILMIMLVAHLPASAAENRSKTDFARAAARTVHGYRKLFNLGGMAARQKEYGYAALFWSRAVNIYDGDAVLDRNLRSVRKLTGADRYDIGVPALVEVLLFFYFSFSRATLYSLLTLVLLALFLFLNIMVFRRRTATVLFRSVLIGTGVLLVLLSVSLILKTRQTENPGRAVIVHHQVPFRQHLAAESLLLLKLPAALEVTVRENRDGSCRISLPGGGQGWVPADSVVHIGVR